MAFLSMKRVRLFYDENAIQFFDPDHSDDEDRFILLGIYFKLMVLVFCHCFRKLIQLLELHLPEKLMAMKKINIGGIEDERPLRFFQNEGTQKPLYKIFKTTDYYAIGP
jgi:hypothetical protein